jgi:hypothetical protein
MDQYSVVLFHSTAHALRAEKVLERAGFPFKMIPTPRQLSSNCGIALRFPRGLEDQIAAALAENRVPVNGIHPV